MPRHHSAPVRAPVTPLVALTWSPQRRSVARTVSSTFSQPQCDSGNLGTGNASTPLVCLPIVRPAPKLRAGNVVARFGPLQTDISGRFFNPPG